MDSKKLNIAVVIDGDLHGGGGYQQQLNTILKLVKHGGHNFVPYVFNNNNLDVLKKFELDAVLVKRSFFDKVIKRLRIFFGKRPRSIFSKYSEDIDIFYFLSPVSLHHGEEINFNYIFTVWDISHLDFMEFPEGNFNGQFEFRENQFNSLLRRAVAVITDSPFGKENILKMYNLHESRVKYASYYPSLYIESNKDQFDVKKKYGVSGDYIYYPAQFWSHKNHIYIIDALSILREKNIDIYAIFSGSDKGNLGYVLEYAKDKGVADLIKYIGFAPNEELYSLYKNSISLVMPTYFGPTNIPPLEAFSVGTPVIYSDLPGLREQVGDAALLCDLNNPNSLVSNILKLYDDGLRNKLIKKGYKRLQELLENDLISLIEEILKDYSIKRKCWK